MTQNPGRRSIGAAPARFDMVRTGDLNGERGNVRMGRTFHVLGCLALGALLLASGAAVPRGSARDIAVGIAAPMSGRYADRGAAVLRGIAAARMRLAETMKPLTSSLRLVEVDDACSAQKAAEAARRLVAAKVAVVIGHPCGAAALAAAPVYAAAGILYLSLTRHPRLTEERAGAGILRVAGRDDRQAAAIADYVAAALTGSEAVAVLHDRTAYASAIAADVSQRLTALDRRPTLVIGIVAGEPSYPRLLSRLKAVAPRLVVFAGFPSEAAVILAELRATGLAAPLVGSDALATAQFHELAGDMADGTAVPLPAPLVHALRDAAPLAIGGHTTPLRAGLAALETDAATALVHWSGTLRAGWPDDRLDWTGPQSHPGTGIVPDDQDTAANTQAIQGLQFDDHGDAAGTSHAIYIWREGRLVPVAHPQAAGTSPGAAPGK